MYSCKLIDYKKHVFVKQTEQGEIAVWTKAFQVAVDENDFVYIPKGKYYVDDSMILSSNKWIKAHKQAEIILLESCKKLMIRNADVIDGSFTSIDKNAPRTENIRIEGGVFGRRATGQDWVMEKRVNSTMGIPCTALPARCYSAA